MKKRSILTTVQSIKNKVQSVKLIVETIKDLPRIAKDVKSLIIIMNSHESVLGDLLIMDELLMEEADMNARLNQTSRGIDIDLPRPKKRSIVNKPN